MPRVDGVQPDVVHDLDAAEDRMVDHVPKAALDVLDDPYLSYPGELPVKEAGDEILSLAESFLAKVLLGRGHGLGMLRGYRVEIERRTREEAFREGIAFALNVLRRLANSPENTEEWRKHGRSA